MTVVVSHIASLTCCMSHSNYHQLIEFKLISCTLKILDALPFSIAARRVASEWLEPCGFFMSRRRRRESSSQLSNFQYTRCLHITTLVYTLHSNEVRVLTSDNQCVGCSVPFPRTLSSRAQKHYMFLLIIFTRCFINSCNVWLALHA